MSHPTTYAVDFDGTLCENAYPEIGAPNLPLIDKLISRRRLGAKVILWTCREGELLTRAVEFCRCYGLEFDAVNDNTEELKRAYGTNPRKIGADYYIDDKAMVTPNEKEDAEVYPVVILDPNGNDYTKGIAAWLTAIAKQNPKNLVCIARSPDPEKPGQAVYTLMRWETKGIELSEIAGYLTSVASELFSREHPNSETPL